MKKIPNLITILRIILSISIIFLPPFKIPFFIMLFLIGLTDVLDGLLARKLQCTSSLGSTLDSLSDLVFIIVISIILFIDEFHSYILYFFLGVLVIKLISIMIGFIKYKMLALIHTIMNKIVGLVFFLYLFLVNFYPFISTIILASIAFIAAIEELIINIKNDNLNQNEKGLFITSDLWILYSVKFKDSKAPLAMNYEALKMNINSKLKYFENFKIENDKIYYHNRLIRHYPKAILFRGFYMPLTIALEKHTKVINNSYAMDICKDKYKCYELLNTYNIKQPKTIKGNNQATYQDIAKELGSTFVIKENMGMRGRNVVLVHNEHEFDENKNTISYEEVIFQKYIESSFGKDIRCYIIGDKIVGTIVRKSESDDFRANVSLGGSFANYEVPNEIKEEALKIKSILKGEVISVDYLFTENGFIFCEANGNAAFKAYNRLGYKMTYLIIKYVYDKYLK